MTWTRHGHGHWTMNMDMDGCFSCSHKKKHTQRRNSAPSYTRWRLQNWHMHKPVQEASLANSRISEEDNLENSLRCWAQWSSMKQIYEKNMLVVRVERVCMDPLVVFRLISVSVYHHRFTLPGLAALSSCIPCMMNPALCSHLRLARSWYYPASQALSEWRKPILTWTGSTSAIPLERRNTRHPESRNRM